MIVALGAGSRPEGVETGSESAFELIRPQLRHTAGGYALSAASNGSRGSQRRALSRDATILQSLMSVGSSQERLEFLG